MQYAIIENNTVINVIEAEDNISDFFAGSASQLLPAHPWTCIGDKLTEKGDLPHLQKHQPSLEEEKNAAYTLIDAATSTVILAGFDYDIDPGTGEAETLHFSYDSFDQQNFADTANVAALALSGTPGLPESVTWNAYRNYTPETGGELVRLTLAPQTFLALYTGGALAHKAAQMETGGQRKAMIEATGSRAEIATYLQEWGLLKDELA